MGVDPYLIAPTLKLALAQRLARTLCPGTGIERPVDRSMEIMMEKAFETLPNKYRDRIPTGRTVMDPQPSPTCATGMRGRTAVVEALEINEEIQELILKNASEEEMYLAARKHGFMTMQEDAIIKAINHIIPYQEMNAFGTKVGLDALVDAPPPVDNQPPTEPEVAIMEPNEATYS
jgi:type II secretory ATPase GspE/PulE/Tfp pilus assembly ATPase PilB-like protein